MTPVPKKNSYRQVQPKLHRRPLRRVIRLIGEPSSKVRDRIPIALELVIGLALLILTGAVLFKFPQMTTQPITFLEALFTATSASAVTGLSLFPISTGFTLWGKVILMLLVQIGGIGLIVVIALFFRLIGRQVNLADQLAVASSLHLDNPRHVAKMMVRALAFMIVIEAIGAVLLYLHWRMSGIVPPGQVAFYAIFHAVTAYCNAGFDLFSGLPQYPNGLPTDPIRLIILGTLIVLGGLGLPVYMDLLRRRTRGKLNLHTRVTFIVSAVLLLSGFLGLLISEYHQGGVLTGMSFFDRALLALFQSASARTAGFAGLPDFGLLQPSSSLLIIVLMFIGTAPASTGGGITTGTFVVLVAAVISYARGLDKIRIGKRNLPDSLLLRALVVLSISITIVILATWLMLLTSDFSLIDSLFEVTSAYSTTGLSLGITSNLNNVGRLIIILTMFSGRLGAITIMIALLERSPRQKLLDYPDEQILVG